MSYATDQMRDAIAGHRLKQVCNSGGVRVFRMAAPGTGIMAVDIIFAADRIGITGDIILGPHGRGLWSDLKYGFWWFAGSLSERYLCEKFLRQVWSSRAALEAMGDMLQQLREDFQFASLDECSRAVALRDGIAAAGDGSPHDPTRSAEAFHDFWTENIDCDGPEDLGHDYDPTDAGWLCAIQQRFAELWAERVARIEAIVTGWEWTAVDPDASPASWLASPNGVVGVWTNPDGWGLWDRNAGQWIYEEAGNIDAAKLAARAAVLAQAIEHPELWYCQEVEQ